MGETVIESLVIKLGLNADGLNADKANKSIESIRTQVKGLNEDLKGVESTLRTIGTQFGGFGKSFKPDATVRREKVKPATQAGSVLSGNVLAFPGGDKPPKTKPQGGVTPDQHEKKKKETKVPTSLGGAISSLGGQIGMLAGGIYLLKNTVESVAGVVRGFMDIFKSAMVEKNVAAVSGLKPQDVDFFKAVGAQFGDMEGAIAKNIVKFGQTKVSAMPGEYHLGLARMAISPLDVKGGTRDTMELLKEIAAKSQTMAKNDEDTYRFFRQWFDFDKTTVDMLQKGPSFLDKMPEFYRKEMLSKTNKDIEAGAKHEVDTALGAQKLKTATDKAAIDIWGLIPKLVQPTFGKNGLGPMAFSEMIDQIGKFTGVQSSSVPVKPTISAPAATQMGAKNGSIDNMTINVSVDKDGSAAADVEGFSARRVMVNPAPYKVAS